MQRHVTNLHHPAMKMLQSNEYALAIELAPLCIDNPQWILKPVGARGKKGQHVMQILDTEFEVKTYFSRSILLACQLTPHICLSLRVVATVTCLDFWQEKFQYDKIVTYLLCQRGTKAAVLALTACMCNFSGTCMAKEIAPEVLHIPHNQPRNPSLFPLQAKQAANVCLQIAIISSGESRELICCFSQCLHGKSHRLCCKNRNLKLTTVFIPLPSILPSLLVPAKCGGQTCHSAHKPFLISVRDCPHIC